MAQRSREGFHRAKTRPEHMNQLFTSIRRQCWACGHTSTYVTFRHLPGTGTYRLLDHVVCPVCGHEGNPIGFPLVEVEP